MQGQEEGSKELRNDIINLIRKCVKCRFCFTECPIYEASDGWLTRGSSGITQSLYYGVLHNRTDTVLRDILMQCTTCRSCEIICERMMAGVHLVEAIQKGRRLLLEVGVNPIREQQKALESLQQVSNPYGKPEEKRTLWAKQLNVPFIEDVPGVDTLYYTGCTASYDPRIQQVAAALVEIMKKTETSFAVMKKEKCCGDPAFIMGEQGLFEILMQENQSSLKVLGVQRVVTSCPHGFNAFKNLYPEESGGEIKIEHHTQLIAYLVRSGRLKFRQKSEKPVKATYHDPCYLGKHNAVYDEPRSILNAIPDIQFVEMARSRDKSLCCGGGGGRMWADLDGQSRLSQIRVEEAMSVDARLLITACPFCLQNLEDAVKTMDLEGRIEVMDLAELVARSM